MITDDNQNTSPHIKSEVNLIHYWNVMKKYWRSTVCIVVIASMVVVVVSLLLPKKWKAEALIVPVSSSRGGGGLSALASQFGGLASLAGINLSGAASDVTKLVTILKSRTLIENVIEQEHLTPILFPNKYDENGNLKASVSDEKKPNMESAVRKMRSRVNVTESKKNKTVKIAGIFREPKVAARVTNAYVKALQDFINDNAFTRGKRNRIFIEEQLEQNKRDFLEAGKEVNEFYKKNRISAVEADVDVDVMIDSLADNVKTDDGETARFAQLEPSSFDKLKTKISGLMMKKKSLEAKFEEAKLVKDVPQQVYLTYLMMRRELLAKVNALLTTQYEMAKIEETKEELGFQVIDWAVIPIERYSPRRAIFCMKVFFAALFFAVFLAFIREYIQKMKMLHR